MSIPRYAYRFNKDGEVIDLRFVQDDYKPEPGEVIGIGEPLPDPKTLAKPKPKRKL
jgi:hypothetical protein